MTAQILLGRRHVVLGAAAALVATDATADAAATVRLGVLPFGTVQWVAETIRRNRLDAAHGFMLAETQLANTEAAKTALMGSAVDVAVSDWPFVAAQRLHGGRLSFAPFSASLGGIMVPAGSALRRFADLRGKRLGVAGGAADKSWLVVQAAARREGVDLAREATISYGAPPLLNATLMQGRLDALLIFWNFAARLEARGYGEMISVAACAQSLGVQGPLVLVGYVFDEIWASRQGSAAAGFLAAAQAAVQMLQRDQAAWDAVRPLMQVQDDREFATLRARFLAGAAVPAHAAMAAQAGQLLMSLAAAGVAPASELPQGTIWQGQG